MQKEAFKIMGALLVLVLAVSFSVGAVSAAQSIYDGPVTVVNGAFAQTAPPVDYTNPGHYVYANTDAGVLNAAYDAGSFTYNLTNEAGIWYIDDINGVTATEEKDWYVYVNDNRGNAGELNPATLITADATVAFVYTATPADTLAAAVANSDYYIRAAVTYQSAPISFYTGNVVSDAGTFTTTINDWQGNPVTFSNIPQNSGLGVLMRGAGANNANYAYSLGAGSYGTSPYTWLNSIDNYSPDWSATGQGYTIFKQYGNNNTIIATDSLEKFSLSVNDSLIISSTASSSGGVAPAGYTGTVVTDAYGTQYYPDAATHTLKLTLVAA